MKNARCLLIAVACWGIIAQSGADDTRKLSDSELGQLLDELEVTLGTLNSVQTMFTQEKHLAIFQDVVLAKGILYFSRPDQVRFEIVKPFHSVLIAAGRSLAQYELIDGQWEKLRTGGQRAILTVTQQIAEWLQGRFRERGELYDVSASQGERTRIILTARDKDFAKRISHIDVFLNEARSGIDRIEIHELGDDFTVIVFSNQARNKELPAGIFQTSGAQPVIPQSTAR